jgi:hypothetical protein
MSLPFILRERRTTRRRSQAGQAIVLIALTGTLMIGGVGIAVDVAVGFVYSSAAERAAAAAALSGVVFMPDQFTPASAVPLGSGNDATDRATTEARRNGFDTANAVDGVVVVPTQVSGHPNQLRVTVARKAPVFFMQIFGFQPYQVARSAIAAYLPPISLGQSGPQIGSTLGDLGRTKFYFTREEGWHTDRGQGDSYTPSPFNPPASAGATDDVHQISFANGTEPQDATLTDRGGYNYRISIPAGGPGGAIQVYNAGFAPDGTRGSANRCDNNAQDPNALTCSVDGNNWLGPVSGNNWFHEDDGGPFSFGSAANYSTMRYSLFRVNNIFIRSSDVPLSQLTVYPIDARNYKNANQQYLIMGGPNIGQTVDQQYSGGLPTNMFVYHNWVDVASYNGASDNGLISLRQTAALSTYYQGGALTPGTYRLRVDTLDNTGATFNGANTTGHKGYAVRAVNGDVNRSACATCQAAGWDEICFFTPFDAGPGGQFKMQLFQLTPDYAGLTVSVDIWDVGDISSSTGFVRINILDPSGAVASAPQGINIYNLGSQRSNLARGAYSVYPGTAGSTTATFVAQDTNTGVSSDNLWVHLEIPIPANYNPPPGQYWWSMQYVTGAGTVAVDTVTVAVGLKGGPVHLIG